MKKVISILAILALCPAWAQADVVINVTAGLLYGPSTATRLPQNSTVVLLADLDGDGFGNLTNPNSFLGDPNDFIVGRVGSDDILAPGSLQQPLTFIGAPSLMSGLVNAPLRLVWYNLPFNAAATGPGANVPFGTYSDSVGIDGSAPWIFPSDGSTVSLNFFTAAVGGSNLESAAITNFATAPEPASMLMVLMAGGLLSARARKRAR